MARLPIIVDDSCSVETTFIVLMHAGFETARVVDEKGSDIGKFTYDVFLSRDSTDIGSLNKLLGPQAQSGCL